MAFQQKSGLSLPSRQIETEPDGAPSCFRHRFHPFDSLPSTVRAYSISIPGTIYRNGFSDETEMSYTETKLLHKSAVVGQGGICRRFDIP